MNQDKSQRALYTSLWRITAFVAAVLLVITIALAVKTGQTNARGFYASTESVNPTVTLREKSNWSSRIVAILESGTQVFVDDQTTVGATEWFHVNAENVSGWVSSRYISTQSP
jgi:uncharacterized protein YgiM (DUF1202 family)